MPKPESNIRAVRYQDPCRNPQLNLILRTRELRRSSRLVLLATDYSFGTDWFWMNRPHLSAVLGCTIAQLRRAEREVDATGLFSRDEAGRLWRRYLPGEAPDEFARRARRHPGVEVRVRVAWLQGVLFGRSGTGPHSSAQIAAQVGAHLVTTKRAIGDLEAVGLIERRVGCGRGNRTYYVLATAPEEVREDAQVRATGTHGGPVKGSRSVERVADPYERVADPFGDPPKGGSSQTREDKSLREPRRPPGGAPQAVNLEGASPGSENTEAQHGRGDREAGTPKEGGAGYNSSTRGGEGEAVDRVVRFPDRAGRVIPVLGRTGESGFVRAVDAARVLADLVAVVRRERSHQVADDAQRRAWAREILRLLRRLDDPDPAGRVYRVMRWYLDHHADDRYVPVIESGSSLRDKFNRLEAAMAERTPRPEPEESPSDVIRAAVLDPTLARNFEAAIYRPARSLGLGDDLAVARALVTLHLGLREERRAARVPSDVAALIGGIQELLARYVSWLGDQSWLGRATVKVLDAQHSAFAQFRREEAEHGAHGDPITGRMR